MADTTSLPDPSTTTAAVVTTTSTARSAREGPGGHPVGPIPIIGVVLIVALLAIGDLYALMKVWPHPTPSGAATPSQQGAPRTSTGTDSSARVATGGPVGQQGSAAATQPAGDKASVVSPVTGRPGRLTCDTTITPKIVITPADSMTDPDCVSIAGRTFPVWAEQRLLLIVILAGALGGLLHAVRSVGWYVGNRSLVLSWLPFYAFLPLTGALIAVAFYLVIRGGFFSPSGSIRDTSPFGFAAMATLVGMFSTPAALKLQQLAETMLTKPSAGEDARPQSIRDSSTSGTSTKAATSTAASSAANADSERGELERAGEVNTTEAAG